MIWTKFYFHNKSIQRGTIRFGLTLLFFQSLSTYWSTRCLEYSLKILQWLQSFFKALLTKTYKKKRKRKFSFKAILLEHEFQNCSKKYHHLTRDKNDDFQNYFFVILGVFSSKNALTFFGFFVKIAVFFIFKIQVNSKSALSLGGGSLSRRFLFFWK